MATEIVRAIEDYVPRFPTLRDAAIARARTFTWQRTAQGVLAAYRSTAQST
jgi:hypothetical protein